MSKPKYIASINDLVDSLGSFKKCPKKQCKGTLISVLTRYENNGTINYEQECSECSKVIRDSRFKNTKNCFNPRGNKKHENRSKSPRFR